MHKPRTLIIVAMLLLVIISGGSPGQGQARLQEEGHFIRLKAAVFNPLSAQVLDSIPQHLTIEQYAPGQQGYFLVQFQGPIELAWKDQLVALGVELLHYVPDFAFKVRMTPEQAAQVQQLPNVVWTGIFHPAYKLAPSLQDATTQIYRVYVERGASAQQVETDIVGAGIAVLQRDGNMLMAVADAGQLDFIARILDVAWIENFMINETHNEYGAGVIIGADTVNANGYDGSSQIAAVADTGLGDGSKSGAHRDIPAERIEAIYDWTMADIANCADVIPNEARDVDSGHGTHVAGSVLSDGGTGGEGQGAAPAARLVFQAVEDYVDFYGSCITYSDGYRLIGLPSDLGDLFQQAYDAGVRIHANSWGSSVAGEYTTDSANSDTFIWNNADMLITFSAGNEGVDQNRNGIVDDDSIGSPATAKNVLTVGASENDRDGNYQRDTSLSYTNCAAFGGQNAIMTYGGGWPSDFPVNPLFSDAAAGNAEQMAAFSSRGPTDDGRIKPDVVAPGTYILSAYSDMYQRGYDGSRNPQNNAWQSDGWGYPLNQYYKYMGGTSMSNPIAAGGAIVVRDFYDKAHSHNASAALVKATLINSAVDMLDENNDGADDNYYPIPNSSEGWGRIDLMAATDDGQEWIDNTGGLTTGGSSSSTYTVSSSGSPFKATLVWSDYPASTSVTKTLVNDLDLVVTAPNDTIYRGNVFSGGWSQTGGSADRTNNVENVYVQSAEAGIWKVEVRGDNVPNGPQPFAVVVDRNNAGTIHFSAASYNVGEQEPTATITVVRSDGNNGAVGVTCATTGGGTATAGSDYTAISTSITFADGDASSKTCSVPINNDGASEGGETINLILSNPTGGAVLGTLMQAIVTIRGDIYRVFLPLAVR